MESIVSFLKKNFILISAILLGVYFLGDIFSIIGYFGSENAAEVTTGVFKMIIDVALIVLFILVYLTKKFDVLKVLLVIMLISFAYGHFRGFPETFGLFEAEGAFVVFAILYLVLQVTVASIFVFYIISLFSDKLRPIQNIIQIAALVVIPLSVTCGVLMMIGYGQMEAGVFNYISAIGSYFAFIPLMAITYLIYFHGENKPAKKEAE